MNLAAAQPLKPLDLVSRSAARPTTHDQLVKQTEKWVAQTFFGTLLKQMAQSPFKSDVLSGGRGGQAFSSLYHQQLAERMAGGAGGTLVNSIVRRIEARAAYQQHQTAPASGKGRRDVRVAAASRA